MAHTARDKKKLLDRLKRIRGQLIGVEKAVEEERECGKVLLTLAASRGAINSLMAVIMEGHVRHHVLPQGTKSNPKSEDAAEELIEVIKRYPK